VKRGIEFFLKVKVEAETSCVGRIHQRGRRIINSLFLWQQTFKKKKGGGEDQSLSEVQRDHARGGD